MATVLSEDPGGGDTYLVVRGVGGCEVRLGRTIDLVHNIQTAHGSPQRSRVGVLLSTLSLQSAGGLHGGRWVATSRVIGDEAGQRAPRLGLPLARSPQPPQVQPGLRSGTGAPGLPLVGI